MHRRRFLGTLGASSILAGPAPAVRAPKRPNIVFIYTDDQRWDALSCAGHPFLKTPNMDRIANEGARFRNAFVTTPLCSPSRATFLTGRYAHAHKVTHNGDSSALSHQLVTFPRLLHDAGYETSFIGKWHMGEGPAADDNPRPGFDRWVGFQGQGVYVDPVLNIDGKRVKVPGYVTDILTGYAVEFIRRERSKPFVLYMGHKAPHDPTTPAERHGNLFIGQSISRSPAAQDTLQGKPMLQRPARTEPTGGRGRLGPGTGTPDEKIRNQLRTLVAVDEGVGQILQALEHTRQLDNTLIIYSSDNGYFWGEHGLSDKRAAYEDSIRIPLIMRYPKRIKGGTLIDRLTVNADIAATALDVAGVPIPANVHGRSLVPLFNSRRAKWRDSFLAEYMQEARYPFIPGWQAVRSERWKYIHYTEQDGMDELYDLKADPYEMKNLIDDATAGTALKRAKADLDRLLGETR